MMPRALPIRFGHRIKEVWALPAYMTLIAHLLSDQPNHFRLAHHLRCNLSIKAFETQAVAMYVVRTQPMRSAGYAHAPRHRQRSCGVATCSTLILTASDTMACNCVCHQRAGARLSAASHPGARGVRSAPHHSAETFTRIDVIESQTCACIFIRTCKSFGMYALGPGNFYFRAGIAPRPRSAK
jgi:hypothetical protein